MKVNGWDLRSTKDNEVQPINLGDAIMFFYHWNYKSKQSCFYRLLYLRKHSATPPPSRLSFSLACFWMRFMARSPLTAEPLTASPNGNKLIRWAHIINCRLKSMLLRRQVRNVSTHLPRPSPCWCLSTHTRFLTEDEKHVTAEDRR